MSSKGVAFLMDMGTGKTLVTIALAGTLSQRNKIHKLLVVAPKSILSVWEDEFFKFADFDYQLTVPDGDTAKKSHTIASLQAADFLQVVVLNYESVWRLEDELLKWNADMISAYAAHSFQFVKRLSKEERKKWGYAGIWEMATVKANKEHPAMYPVELPWRCIKMHSDKGEIVLEPFSGSGTTIIACEQTDRICYAMEKSPEYCDVAVKRWEEFTGKTAELIREE